MSNIVPFEFEHHQVRVIDQSGEPWFVLLDVCLPLGIADHHQVFERLDDDERGRYPVPTPGGTQLTKCVNESGLYTTILRSDKPEAKRFRKWVTSEVLPAIRKTGRYEGPKDDAVVCAEGMLAAARVIERQREQLAIMAPKAQSFDQLMDATGLYSMRNVAKILRVTNIFQELEKRGIFYRSRFGSWVPKQRHITAKRFVVKVGLWGDNRSTATAYATPAGLEFLRKLFGSFIDPDLFHLADSPAYRNN
jgi:prophage antirepressor-like protein